MGGIPGQAPFTRGVKATMYAGRPWTIRQYAGFSTAEASNEFYRKALAAGQQGVSVAFDLATHRGYDSDHERVEGDVGKAGVAIDSVEDMKILFDGIPLDKMSVSMTMNGAVIPCLAFYIVAAEEQEVSRDQLSGTIQNDILKEYIARNTYIYPPQPSMRLIGDMIEFCAEKVPSWYPVSISGYHMREAGCTATQEIAFTLANAIAYIQTCLDKGLKIDDFAPRLSFFFCCTIEFFEEVAKFRVARKIYAKILKEKFHAKNPRSLQLKFHTQTSGESLTAQQPNNNIIRVAIQTMAAVAGGTQSLHTNSRDEALALPTQESAKIALRTQQIVAHESGITKTADPLAGSYYLEDLCDKIEADVWKYLKKIEKMGGSVKAIEKGFFQSEIRANAYRLKKETDDADRIIVGVNKYSEEEEQPELLRIDGRIEVQQKKALKKLRADRDSKKLEKALSAMQSAADTEENLMPYIVTAAKAFATTGEISNTFREVFGEYRPKEVF